MARQLPDGLPRLLKEFKTNLPMKIFKISSKTSVSKFCVMCLVASTFFGCGKSEYSTYTIRNSGGMTAKFCENGARLMELTVPDKDGRLVDVVAGFDDPADYDTSTEPYYGATIGRYGNRIAKGKFILDGKPFQLTINNGTNTLHGGKEGFQYQKWTMEKQGDSVLVCRLIAPDGENGFPGQLSVNVKYTVTKENALLIEYQAQTDKPTVINLTNHAFFNLNGSGSILKHVLMINANAYLPVDRMLIPTGEIRDVEETPFDFRGATTIGSRIAEDNEQLKFGMGYDHNFVLNKSRIIPSARVRGDRSGIVMQVFTDQPGLQFYSGNFMKGDNMLRTGADELRTAFCLETQHFPDSPNQKDFPSTVLRPGELYRSTSRYAFSTEK